MTNAPRIPCGEQVSYYSSWETDTWLCRCGWTATGKEASSEAFSALLQVDCPKCDGRLCLVLYPSPAEERAAAKAGNAEAQRAVDAEKNREEREERHKTTKEIHREQAWFEDNGPLRRYCRYVAKRYGDRAKTFTIDGTAIVWLSGDSLNLYYEQADILKEFGLVEKESDA